jgi:mono/diheme cytochrome c family protein
MYMRFLSFVLLLASGMCLGISSRASAETLLERGTYLVNSIAGCGNCHTLKDQAFLPRSDMELAGGRKLDEKPFTVYMPNITPDKETGIGTWTDQEIITAIREGRRPDGRILGPPMPYHLYRGISDRDVKAIVAYLRSIKPIRNKVAKSVYRIKLPKSRPRAGSVPEVPRNDKVKYGEYLAGPVGHCIACHTPRMKGGHDYKRQFGAGGSDFHGPIGTTFAANITPDKETGIGNWSDRQIKAAISTGYRASGEKMNPPMPYPYYKKIRAEDLDAIVAYLRTLKPIKKERKVRHIPPKLVR